MSKRRGFTLTEIVVVIALTSLVLAMVGGCLYFVSTYSGTLISKSEELTKVQTIETYLRGQLKQSGNNFASLINFEDGENLVDSMIAIDGESNLLHNQQVVVKNTGLEKILIYNDGNGFVRCLLEFKSGNDYTFILGIVQK